MGELIKTSQEYPRLLRSIKDAPKVLYYAGEYNPAIFFNTLAVVGSRAVTAYGEWVVTNIVKELARAGLTIVSGFMYGVDALAHKAALDAAGKTIAVMAGGVSHIFPSYQEDLYNRIVATGLVVSEFNETCMGGGWSFVRRNRIVAGLSKAVFVVEAGESSGSLITAGIAKACGRKLFTVPSNLNSLNSFGTTKLLKAGATLVSEPGDILNAYPFSNITNNSRVSTVSSVNKRLLNADWLGTFPGRVYKKLCLEPQTADDLARYFEKTITEVLTTATELVMGGDIHEKEGKYYVN